MGSGQERHLTAAVRHPMAECNAAGGVKPIARSTQIPLPGARRSPGAVFGGEPNAFRG